MTRRHRHTAARRGRPDPGLVLSCLVALGVYLVHGFEGVLARDLAVYAYAGQQVADGHLPYVAIINRVGPLAHAVPGLGAFAARLVGADDVLGMRVLLMLVSVACVGLAYVLGRDLFRWRPAGLATAATLLCFEGFTRYATYGPREKTILVLCLFAVLLAVLRQRWLTAGLFVSLGTLTWQPVFPLAIAGVVVAVVLGLPSGRLKALGRVVAGGLVPAVAVLAAYLLTGRIRLLLDDFLLINLEYTHQPSLLDLRSYGWPSLQSGFGVSVWAFLVGMLALLVLAGRALAARRLGRDPRRAALVGAGAVLVIGLLWSLKAYNSWPDTFVLMPMASLGVGGLVGWLAQRLPRRAALAVALAWVLAATAIASSYAWSSRDDRLVRQRTGYEGVLALLPEHPRLLGLEAPELLVFARERNLTRYQLLGQGLLAHLDATWPGGREGFAEWVVRKRPDLVVLGRSGRTEWLGPMLRPDYTWIARTPGRSWFVPSDVDKRTREELLEVIKANFPSQSPGEEGIGGQGR